MSNDNESQITEESIAHIDEEPTNEGLIDAVVVPLPAYAMMVDFARVAVEVFNTVVEAKNHGGKLQLVVNADLMDLVHAHIKSLQHILDHNQVVMDKSVKAENCDV